MPCHALHYTTLHLKFVCIYHYLEALTVQCHAAHGSFSDDISGSRLSHQQRALAEVVAGTLSERVRESESQRQKPQIHSNENKYANDTPLDGG